MHNISFWEQPDWRRESTLNPNFLMVVIISLFAIVGFAIISYGYHTTAGLQQELTAVQSQNNAIAADADEARLRKERMATWEEAFEELAKFRRERLIISRQLQALQQKVPPQIVLENLEFNSAMIQTGAAPQGSRRGEGEQILRYSMSLSGSAAGHDAQAAITEFAHRLRPGADTVMGRRLLSSELKNISDGRGAGIVKNFNIDCVYKPAE